MKPLPHLELMPRVAKDIDDCVEFVARQPWGKPHERARDIFRGLREVCFAPRRHPISARRPACKRALRCHTVAQFVIVHIFSERNRRFPAGKVSIRAIRHRRVGNVFEGVKEPPPPFYGDWVAH